MLPRLSFLLLLIVSAGRLAAEPPQAIDPRLIVELSAREPEVRTPTAIDVDARGRVWVLENNTHFRPKNYDAPPADQVLILDDFGPDGKARRITEFATGFRDGMGLKLLPDGSVIVSTRAETFRLRDTKGGDRADEHVTLLKLDTKDDYPHDGLTGIALDGAGHLFAGLGENHGVPWTISGSDGAAIKGSDEGGIFRCNLDGTKLERWALGLWNPFGLTLDDAGRLFALDNDPGAGSFCRLLQIVRHGDYGYRYRYGRTIDYPFLSWFGQIPGTLPPVCLVGEAPTGILQYHGTSLPSELQGQLLGCTWNDHGIQRFPLVTRGVSFSSNPEWLVRGGNDFRPTGIAQAPDGSLVIADWVDGAYEVHGKGRVWRVRVKQPATAPSEPDRKPSATPVEAPHALDAGTALHLLGSEDPFVFHAAIDALAAEESAGLLAAHAEDPDARVRLGVLLAFRRGHIPAGIKRLPKWLLDSDGQLRRAALQWISEEHLSQFQLNLDGALAAPLSRSTFESYLAAIQMLVSGHPDAGATVKETRQIALDSSNAADLRALAVRLLPVDASALDAGQIGTLLQDPDVPIKTAALRILAARKDDASQSELRRIAADTKADAAFRAEAIAGLVCSVEQPETQAVLREALASQEPLLLTEALRALRGHLTMEEFTLARQQAPAAPDLKEQLMLQTRLSPAVQSLGADPEFAALAASHPPAAQPWPAVEHGEGDPAAGRRLFYHPKGPGCYTCHTIEGRGGNVGPDLTQIGKLTPGELLVAIREPSKDIAPAFTQWLLKLKDGREVTGIDAFEDNKSAVFLIGATGARTKYNIDDIVSREPLAISMMPPGLDLLMTEQEMRDLIAFLRQSRD